MRRPDRGSRFRAWSPDPLRLRDRLARRFAEQGYRFPDFAADVTTWRGTTKKTRTELADEIGVAEAEIAAAEAGDLDPDDAAPALQWGARRHIAELRRRAGG